MSPLSTPPPQRSIQWCASLQPGGYGFSSTKQSTSAGWTNNNLFLSPVYFHRSVVLDRVGFEVTAATAEVGALFRPGIYADNGNLYPGALLLDAGPLSSGSVAIVVVTTSLVVPAGLVWLGGCFQANPSAKPTMRSISGSPPLSDTASGAVASANAGYSQSGISGALPATFTASMGRTSVIPRMLWRIAA